jgi:hypothetical protein
MKFLFRSAEKLGEGSQDVDQSNAEFFGSAIEIGK